MCGCVWVGVGVGVGVWVCVNKFPRKEFYLKMCVLRTGFPKGKLTAEKILNYRSDI